jgi:hypothetical protein
MLTEEESRQVLADWGGGGPEDGRDAVGIDDLPAGFDDADDAELDALLDQLSPGEPSNDE